MKQQSGRLVSKLKLIFELARNDFSGRYSGNMLGVFWAFVQPVVTIFIYIFVFQFAFRAGNIVDDYPYSLWLIAGIVPWFFYNEALLGSSNVFVEYSYLVKKVVFGIDVLPAVKIVSSLFVHLFFILMAIVIFLVSGYGIDLGFLQIFYYLFCLICLILALSYLTSTIVVFFRDFNQIINIILQIMIWLTPIMWNYKDFSDNWILIFKLNPMFYIVRGYRDCFIGSEFFWKYPLTVYFWVFVIVAGLSGLVFFKKMKTHFPDVL